jgi:predicted GNAT family acetyltransferase
VLRLARVDDPTAFLEQAAPLLLADEARHNLLLGLAGTLRDHPQLYGERRLWLVHDGGRPVAAALRTPPFNLVLARPESVGALDALLAGLADEPPGVTGALPESGDFAVAWCERRGLAPRTTMRQGVYALHRVDAPPQPPGSAREATASDRALVLEWWQAFAAEAIHEGGPGAEHAERTVDQRLASDTAGIRLWEDGGRPVSLAGWGGRTPNGIRIGPVYTPPELRGRGYATALTAELSQRLLDAGRRFCFLYTDLANPTSNAIYERIGYRRVCESAEIAFDRPRRSEELLQLHRRAHVALDLDLAGHVGARRVLLPGDDLLEGLPGRADRHVGVAAALGHAHRAVLDVHLPQAGPLDVEHVRVGHPGGLRRVGAAREGREELLHALGHFTAPCRGPRRVYAALG